MRARVPQDVDLEDKLIYGLSPLRFAYLVVGALGALSLWRLESLSVGIRLIPCLLLATAGGVLAWGRFRGRSLDGWLLDLAVFARRNYRLQLSWRRRAPTVVPLQAINALGAGLETCTFQEPDLPRAA
jgi:PrgI family protein